jgi:hypothetical protein
MAIVTLDCAVGNVQHWDFSTDSGFDNVVADVYILYLDTSYFSNKNNHFSLQANVRDPAKTKATGAMELTLKGDKKNRFWAYNGGLILVAKHAKMIGKKQLEMTIPNDFGLLNGGHTQMALFNAAKHGLGKSPPVVRIEVIAGGFSNEQIADIARARNTVANVAAFSVLNKSGALEPLHKQMNSSYINKFKWKQNDKAAVEGSEKIDNVTHRLQILHDSMKAGKSSGDVKSIHSGTESIIEKMVEGWGWVDNSTIHLTTIVNECIALWDAIKYDFGINPDTGKGWKGSDKLTYDGKNLFSEPTKKNNTSLISGNVHNRISKEQVIYPVFAAFGVLLDLKPNKKTIRWKKNPLELWKQKELRENLYNRFRSHCKANPGGGISNLKKNPTLISALKNEISEYQAKKAKTITDIEYSW